MATRREFLKQAFAAGALTSAPALAFQAAAQEAAPEAGGENRMAGPLDVGAQKQLFIDNRFIESSEGVALLVSPAQKTGERLLGADPPWEPGGLDFAFNVLEDGGVFRMWYSASVEFSQNWKAKIFYAESPDGLAWTRPTLGLIEVNGTKENNCVFDGPHGSVSGQTVFIDPLAPPEERYKMLFGDFGAPVGAPLGGAYSADGLHWSLYPEQVIPQGCDTQDIAFYDQRIGKYVAYTRHNVRPPGSQGIRRVARTEADDFRHFPAGTVVFAADEQDPPATGVYNMATTPYPFAQDVYLGFPSFFWGEAEATSQLLDVHLAVSRDGIRWERPSREPFLALGADGSFDPGMVFCAPGVFRVGDELWIYTSGYTVDHAHISPVRPTTCVYSRARLRMDGFVAAHTGPDGGVLTTPPITFTGSRLELGVDLGALGAVGVALLDEQGAPIPGFAAEDMDPIYGNHIAKAISWKGNADLAPLTGRPVKLQFMLRSAKLYAFQFA